MTNEQAKSILNAYKHLVKFRAKDDEIKEAIAALEEMIVENMICRNNYWWGPYTYTTSCEPKIDYKTVTESNSGTYSACGSTPFVFNSTGERV